MTLLERSDDAVARADAPLAVSLLRRYYAEQPSPARASAVIARLGKPGLAAGLRKQRVAVLRSFTVEPALQLLRASALCHGLDLDLRPGGFGAWAQEMLEPSWLRGLDPDVVLVAVQTRDLVPEIWERFPDLTPEQVAGQLSAASAQLAQGLRRVRLSTRAAVVICNFEQPERPATGLLDAQASDGQGAAIESLNLSLRALAAEAGLTIVDYDGLVARCGRSRFHDERRWLTMRMPVSAEHLPDLADAWLRPLLALTGLSRKVLVVDLDNTLWGGVVGEDGMSGLKLGSDYPGAGYRAVQRAVLDLVRRGVLLAVASKNNEADAFEVFDRHPGMLLGRQHLAAFRIGWNDKARSLRELAQELNVGLSALVFLDDNPAEREQVQQELPEVYVIEAPADPLQLAAALRKSPVFERARLTQEDLSRTQLYRDQRERAGLQAAAGSLEEFYRSLQMEMVVANVGPANVARVAQLTQKTNQFNLTTRRYSEEEVSRMSASGEWLLRAFSVRDRFGDNGLVGVAFVRTGAIWELDTFLLSCRVIGRTVETGMLAALAGDARKAGVRALRGTFLATRQNEPARGFFGAHHFALAAEQPDRSDWELDLSRAPGLPDWLPTRVPEN